VLVLVDGGQYLTDVPGDARRRTRTTLPPERAAALGNELFDHVHRLIHAHLSPSWMSIARLVFPSRLELKSLAGSFNEAPLANVSFTTDLYVSPTDE
jgi:hypothetical protein